MKEWFTAAELTALPGLPATDRAVQLRARREGWQWRTRAGRGGGREYHISALPEPARVELVRRQAQVAADAGVADAARLQIRASLDGRAVEAARQAGLAGLAAMPEKSRRRAEARAAIVRACDAFIRTARLPKRRGREVFAQAYNAGEIPVEAWVKDEIGHVCGNSIDNWRKALDREGLARLGGRYGHRKGSGILDSDAELNAFVLGLLQEYPHASAKHVMRGLRARFAEERLPSYRVVQRWLARWKEENAQLFTAVSNPDAWRSRYQAAGGNAAEAVVALNQRWEMDSTKADILLADGTRHAIIGVIDVYSRRLRLLVSRTSKATAIAALLRRTMLEWGVPETIGTDNGADDTSRYMLRVTAGLGIEQHLAQPFAPEQKPFIERAFGTFCRDLVELLPGFVGHSVAERQAIEARKSFAQRLMRQGETVELRMSPEDLQAFCDRWCDQVYGVEPHSGLGGKSPFQAAAEWQGPIRRVTDERALDVLLAEAPDGGLRTVTKKGIRLDGAYFEHPALGGLEGRQVRVLLDEADIGRIYVFEEEGPFICVAECPERTGISRSELSAARKAHQRKVIAEQKKALREAAQAARTKDIVGDILEERARAAGKLVSFPKPTEEHTTPALQEAARAARADEPPPPAGTDAERQARRQALVHELEAARPIAQETPKDRFRRARMLEQRIEAGLPVDEAARRWLEGYRRTHEYRSRKSMEEDFKEFGAVVTTA